jgi:hypothetical protein
MKSLRNWNNSAGLRNADHIRRSVGMRHILQSVALLALWLQGPLVPITAAGDSFVAGPELKISEPPPSYYMLRQPAFCPRIATSGERIAIVWELLGGNLQSAWSYSSDGGNSWTPPEVFRTIQSQGADDYVWHSPDIAANGSHFGGLALYYRSFIGFSLALYEHHGPGDSLFWQSPDIALPFALGPTGTRTTLEMPVIGMGLTAGDLHLAYTRRDQNIDTGIVSSRIWSAARIGGQWGDPQPVSAGAADGPRVIVGEDGDVVILWHDLERSLILARRSEDRGAVFGDTIIVGEIFPNFSAPPRTASYFSRANPIYCRVDLAPTFVSVAVDRSNGPRRGWIYAVWPERLDYVADPLTGPAPSGDALDDVDTATLLQYGQWFTGTAVSPDVIEPNDYDFFAFEGHVGETILMTERITGTSSSYSPCGGGFYLQLRTPDRQRVGVVGSGGTDYRDGVNPPLTLTLPADGTYFTIQASGGRDTFNYYGTLQRIHPAPGSVARDHRDIVMAVSRDGGRTWGPKRLVNDDPPWFDNYMPEVAVDGLGRAYVTWYDRRDDVVAGMNYHVYWTTTTDGGETFAPSEKLSVTQSVIHPIYYSEFSLGDRMGLAGLPEGFMGAWTSQTEEWLGSRFQHDIHARRIDVPTAARVADLAVTSAVGRVELAWRVVEPEVLARFLVTRRLAGSAGDFDSVAVVPRAEDFRSERYTIADTTVDDGTEYEYQVVMVLANGMTRPSDAVSTKVPSRPEALSVRVRPSGNGAYLLEIEAPVAGTGVLRVFNVRGGLIRSLTDLDLVAGVNEADWNGLDQSGLPLASGVYFVELQVGAHRARTKLPVVRP